MPADARDSVLGGPPIAPGDVLLNKYRVERLIGEGGTGLVFLATHLKLARKVAIKLLRRALASDELRTRFEREARAIGKIESEHVVQVLDAGTLDDGAPYMVMEYLDGRDLARVIKEDGPLPVERGVDCVLQVCEALEHAHAHGIVHRDLKPANLFLVRTADDHVHVKVLDFGISKILDKKLLETGKGEDVTNAFAMLGSPRYMAPEQVRNSKDVDARADLWSAGAVLFQLLTGQHAFEAESNVQASLAVITGEPRQLCTLAPHAPVAVEAAVARCLSKDMAARFQSASELAQALKPFASKRARASFERRGRHDRQLAERIDLASATVTLPTGLRDVPTERRIVAAAPGSKADLSPLSARSAVVPPSSVPPMREGSRPVSSRIVLPLLAASAFAVILGGIVALKAVAGGAALRAASPATHPVSSAVVPLDAGKISP